MHRRLNRENDEIRFIRINFNDRNEDDSLSLQLEHHRHGETPYAALSYVWGDPDNQVPILVNNVELPVRRNLYYALDQLRQQRTEARIWVDAICIDQANDDEKSWEVNRMRDVFESAETVYHWLGQAADDSDYLFNWAAKFGREAFQAGMLDFVELGPHEQGACLLRFLADKHPDLLPRRTSRSSSSSNFSADILDEMESADDNANIPTHMAAPFLVQLAIQEPPDLSSARMNKAIEALLRRSFFQRLWIVQELAVSRNSMFLCGSRRLPVNHFDSTLAVSGRRLGLHTRYILYDVKAIANPYSASPNWLRGFNQNLMALPAFEVRRRRHQGQFPSLLSILERSIGYFQMPMLVAADPRDILFGLLGVSGDAKFLNLKADYSKSPVQVFTAVTRAFIRHCKEYDLAFSLFPKDLDGLPSWVPDWSRLCREGASYYPISRGYSRFKASLDKRQPPEHSIGEAEDLPTLVLSGLRLGSITSVLDTQWIFSRAGIFDTPEFIFNKRETEILMNEMRKFCYGEGITDEEIIIRTSIKDNCAFRGIRARTDTTYLGLARKVLHGQEHIEKDDHLSPEDAALLSPYDWSPYEMQLMQVNGAEEMSPIQRKFASFSREHQMRVAACFRRGQKTMFVTDDGRLCLGPSHVQEGDFIAILFGYEAPMVLRPLEGDRCSFVGDAYVDGIMDGEAMEERKHRSEDFKIV